VAPWGWRAAAIAGRLTAAEYVAYEKQARSDVLGRGLPNGWGFGLPNKRYVTDGKSYDHVGIGPTIAVPLFAQADVDAGRDTSIDAALRLLQGRAAK
jgi:C-terminal processing protease CtpA/Prc